MKDDFHTNWKSAIENEVAFFGPKNAQVGSMKNGKLLVHIRHESSFGGLVSVALRPHSDD